MGVAKGATHSMLIDVIDDVDESLQPQTAMQLPR